MEYSINLIKDQLSPNLYKAMAINEDKKAIPEKIKMICHKNCGFTLLLG